MGPMVIAMQGLPILAEIVARGMLWRMVAATATTIISVVVCTGEASALTWIPCITEWLFFYSSVDPPQEPIPYIPKKKRVVKGNWLVDNIPAPIRERILALTQAGGRAMADVRPNVKKRYCTANRVFTYHPRARARARNSRLAKSLRLVVITCLLAASINSAHAFDSDSVSIALDNCSSRSRPPPLKRLSRGEKGSSLKLSPLTGPATSPSCRQNLG